MSKPRASVLESRESLCLQSQQISESQQISDIMTDGQNIESSDDNAFNTSDNRPSSKKCSFPTPVHEWNTSEIKKNLKLSWSGDLESFKAYRT